MSTFECARCKNEIEFGGQDLTKRTALDGRTPVCPACRDALDLVVRQKAPPGWTPILPGVKVSGL